MQFEYRIVLPQPGKEVRIVAKTRSEAINAYHRLTGTPKEFIKKYCVIKNMGRVNNE